MDAGSPANGGLAEALAATIGAQPDLAWLTPLRSEALRRFDAAGFPSTRLEDWRYTDLGEYARRSREITAGVAATAAGAAPALAGRLVPAGMGLVAVFRSGVLDAGLSQPAAPAGLTCTRLAAGAGRAAWLDSLGTDSHEGADPLAALNAALLRDGLALEVAAGARVERPLYVAHVSEPGRTAHNRLVLRLAPGSTCTLIEHQLGQDSGTANSVTDISCGRDARLTYIRLQDEPATALHVAQQRIRLEAGAEAALFGIDLGGKLVRNTLRVSLAGTGAAVDIQGLFFGDGGRHVDNQTRVDHHARGTRCQERYRGIVEDSGRGIFNGKIVVHAGADQAVAELRNENLLLSRNAEVDTKPELEIYTDDVKCAHGATTGQLDPAAVFYLRSRGIGAADARRMLIAAFAREIVGRIPVRELEDHVVGLLAARLPDLAAVGAGP